MGIFNIIVLLLKPSSKMNSAVLITVLTTEAIGLAFNGITLFYIISNFDVKTHVFTLILIGR